jgi:hypothetical protein
VTLLAAPANFRGSWWHNRDYGVFVANPFGREAMKQGDRSEVRVARGSYSEQSLLRFCTMLRNTVAEAAWKWYRELSGKGDSGNGQ